MNEENINKVILSGHINVITDNNDKYIKFGLVSKRYNNINGLPIYTSLNIERDLYNIYKDLFVCNSFIYVNGYMNSYLDNKKKVHNYITVLDVSDNREDIIDGRKYPHIRYDEDGTMVWNGKRCEATPMNPEEEQELKEMLAKYA